MAEINYVDAGIYLPRLFVSDEILSPDTVTQRFIDVIGLRIDLNDTREGGPTGWFSGVRVVRDDRCDGYYLKYRVELGYGMHLNATRFCRYTDGIPDIEPDINWLNQQAALADKYPAVGSISGQCGCNVHLAFGLDRKTGELTGYYTGDGFTAIYCTQPPTNAAIVKRIERKRQK